MPRKHPKRLLPNEDMKALWRETAADLGLSGNESGVYLRKWERFWVKTLDELIEQGTWEDRDRRSLEELVEWLRKADFHARKANSDPYRTHSESGRTFAHPGFKLEADARQQARIVADKLLLGADLDEDEDNDGSSEDSDEL